MYIYFRNSALSGVYEIKDNLNPSFDTDSIERFAVQRLVEGADRDLERLKPLRCSGNSTHTSCIPDG